MGLWDAISISGSGLSAERLRMDVTAENLANAQTTRTSQGGPYRRQEVVLQAATGNGFAQTLAGAMGPENGTPAGGVEVAGVMSDPSPPRMVYDPGHPDANAQGYVAMPNVDTVTEMVDLITEQRSYEADVTAMSTAKQMFTKTLDILK